jgi:hypothetical protein
MTGDDRSRHCGDCKKDVFNIYGMTREEAEALLIERAGNLCVRYYQRSDGTILLADCTIGVRRSRRRRLVAAGAALLASAGGVAGSEASRVTPEYKLTAPVMGEPVAAPLPPPPPPAPRFEGRAMMGAVAMPVEEVSPPPRPAKKAHKPPPAPPAPLSRGQLHRDP